MKLWQIGLLAVIIGGLTNTILIKNEIGGLIRELMRLTILVGAFLFIYGLIKRPKSN